MIEVVLETLEANYRLTLTILVVLAYAVYKWYMHYIIIYMKGDYDIGRKHIGKTVPNYPNGWYIACRSKQLTKGVTKAIDIAGQNIVIARDDKGEAHALYAYCAHMGAHLGVGGEVINGNCVQCPFHGWLYNLETGQCVGNQFEIQIMIKDL